MKYTSLSTLACGAIAAILPLASLSAQSEPAKEAPKASNIEERVAKLKESLALTDEQAAQIKTIYTDQKAKVDAIKADTSLTDEQKSAQTKAAKAETKTKVDAVLTAEQKAKLDEIKQGQKKKKEQ